ncbi:hypothetical protein [Aquimarina sediminis]|uniref:hypothetical protein n=1 Tax=Aquimarina sediminis TaxID=2070536 RepID=UPI000CA05278|nr:hypothetical protein [Aquimarina sediminis]
MKAIESHKSTHTQNLIQKKREPFFNQKGQGVFFSRTNKNTPSFFGENTIQKKENVNTDVIQKQDGPDQVTEENNPPESSTSTTTSQGGGTPRTNRCYTNPEFPDFRCLAYALKLDVDENLWNNAHHFYRVASLYPGNNELMWNTFLRYGLGINLLQTSFGFLGANETLGSVLSYGTGIGLKSFEFFQNGELQLDIPIPLGRGVNLDFQFDLNANPDDLTQIRGVSGGVGLSGHF